MKDPVAALQWIVSELRARDIPFAICGGLAANAYGGSRPLNDIDIDVPDNALELLAKELCANVSFGPEHSISESFDCQLLGLCYLGQEIELNGAQSLRVRDAARNVWIPLPTDLTAIEQREIFGIQVPVMSADKLIAYKRLAGRETDHIDIREMEERKTYNKSRGSDAKN